MKHTQEKWGYEAVTLGKGYENQPALAITTKENELLAIIPSHRKGANHSEYIHVAYLIAAAPELLDELKESTYEFTEVLLVLQDMKVLEPDIIESLWIQIERNKKAIAKAKGA